MSATDSAPSGRTLTWPGGSAALLPLASVYTLRRAGLALASIVALVTGVAAVSIAVDGRVEAGVLSGLPGSTVASVSRTGIAWRAGIRPGQIVVALGKSDDPDGWSMSTTDGRQAFHVSAARADAGLRASLPIAVVGLVLGALACLFVRTRRQWALPAAAGSLVAASVPISIQGDVGTATTVLAIAFVVPAAWAIGWLRRSRPAQLVAGVGAALLLSAWAYFRTTGSGPDVGLDGARDGLAVLLTAGLATERIGLRLFQGAPMNVIRPTMFDLAATGFAGGLAAVSILLLSLPPLVVGASLVLAILLVPGLRRRIGSATRSAFFADVRAEAALAGAEAERARVAAQLHDAPLQEIAAVIRQLELVPGAEAANDELRTIADHLRAVASDLRPPVLDDLGLSAALEALANDSGSAQLPVRCLVVSATGLDHAARPPVEVELAAYRIVAEAVSNAVRHAGATEVRMEGRIDPDRIELVVTDDGRGLSRERQIAAARAGRLGLSIMRRRAEAVDAELVVVGDGTGTRLRLEWHR